VPDPKSENVPALDAVFALLLALDALTPHPSLPKRLGPLLKDLQQPVPSRERQELTELIHALWISNPSAEASALMADAISAIDNQTPAKARSVLDVLVDQQPNWAEVHYKRAIVALMTERPNDAIAHLGETLRLEPRHFAAMSLFGQICLDLDRLYEARFALQRALHQNPHLKGLKETISSISQQVDARNNRLNA
jgi:predicted Zn-dependent protease